MGRDDLAIWSSAQKGSFSELHLLYNLMTTELETHIAFSLRLLKMTGLLTL